MELPIIMQIDLSFKYPLERKKKNRRRLGLP